MEDNLLYEFKSLVEERQDIFYNQRLLVGVSGGIDSSVLCDLLHKVGANFAIAHCNFSLRGEESDRDEAFVRELSHKYKTRFFSKKFFPSGNNIQIWARKRRYEWFEKLRRDNNFDKIVTGHHLDDSVETFLINLLRGTGLEGLTGVKLERGKIVRPLVYFSREQIFNYAKKNDIEWVDDSSNEKIIYLRNNIRHNVVPKLKEINDNFLDNFRTTIKNINIHNEFYLEKMEATINEMKSDYPNAIFSLDINKLINTGKHLPLVLHEALKEYGFSKMINDIISCLKKDSGKEFYDNGYRILKDREKLILAEDKKPFKEEFIIEEDTVLIEKPIKLSFSDVNGEAIDLKNSVAFFNKRVLKYPLILRRKKEGDYFYPSGMNGGKKLSKFLKDEKYSNIEKENLWLLCSNDDKILWIIGKRIANVKGNSLVNKNLIKITLNDKI